MVKYYKKHLKTDIAVTIGGVLCIFLGETVLGFYIIFMGFPMSIIWEDGKIEVVED